MKTIEISLEKIREAYKNGNEAEKKVLADLFGEKVYLSVTDRIKTFADALEGICYSENDFDEIFRFLTRDEIAYVKLKVITEALNEGWKPDWDKEERKYYIWWDMGCSYSYFAPSVTSTNFGSRLCYRSRELAEYCAEQFKGLWEDYLLIPKQIKK